MPSVTVRTQISIMNFIKSPKKWSSQNQTSRTGSYAYWLYIQSFVRTATWLVKQDWSTFVTDTRTYAGSIHDHSLWHVSPAIWPRSASKTITQHIHVVAMVHVIVSCECIATTFGVLDGATLLNTHVVIHSYLARDGYSHKGFTLFCNWAWWPCTLRTQKNVTPVVWCLLKRPLLI